MLTDYGKQKPEIISVGLDSVCVMLQDCVSEKERFNIAEYRYIRKYTFKKLYLFVNQSLSKNKTKKTCHPGRQGNIRRWQQRNPTNSQEIS